MKQTNLSKNEFIELYKKHGDMDRLEFLMKKYNKTLEYKDAELRTAGAVKFFKKILKIEHVEVLRNLSREEMVEVFKQLEKKATGFEHSKDFDTQAVNAVFVNWIGFDLQLSSAPFMKEFDIDRRIFPDRF